MARSQLHVFVGKLLVLSLALLVCGVISGLGVVQAAPQKKEAERVVGPTVAILYFDYSGTDTELGFLRKGLTQMLVTDLSQSESLRIVERTDLEAVLQELKLNQSRKIDKASANRVGKLLGARYLVTGGYFEFQGRLRVDAKVIDVERGTTHGVGVLHDTAEFLTLEAELAGKIQQQLLSLEATANKGRKATRKSARRSKRRAKVKARAKVNARTVAQYGKALDALDRGNKEIAMRELAAITKEAPAFRPAAEDLKVLLR